MTALANPDQAELVESPRLPLSAIRPHPLNPRLDATADDELVDSIRAQGVLEPVMVAPAADGDGWVLVDGHRRYDGATKAGAADVPVNPRPDLVTDAQQLEVMAITGLTKHLLTPVEEAGCYEQLALLGMDDTAIAAATGFSKRRVQQRLKLNSLSTGARDAVHAGEVTLADVAALEEFEDDHEAYAEVERYLGSPNFRSVVHTVRSRQERNRENAAAIESFEALDAARVRAVPGGVGRVCLNDDPGTEFTSVKRLGSWMPDDLGDPATHAGHLGWHMADFEYARPDAYCLDTTVHPEWKTEQPATATDDAEWQRQQAERDAAAARIMAADAARLEWLTEHITGLFPTKSHQALAALVGPFLTAAAHDAGGDSSADLATPTKALAAFAGWLADDVANLFTDVAQWVSDRDEAISRLQLWDWLKSAGYPMSDVDVEWRTRLETRLTELDDGAGDGDG